jgi:superfamily II DNA/RNA helicase
MVRDGRLGLLVATDAASEGLNLQRLSTLINIDLPWNPARLEQRKGRVDRIGQLASSIDVRNLRYRGSVEDDVHRALSSRLKSIREVFGTVPDTLEDVWVTTALGDIEEAKQKIDQVPRRHPFELRYGDDAPARTVSGMSACSPPKMMMGWSGPWPERLSFDAPPVALGIDDADRLVEVKQVLHQQAHC